MREKIIEKGSILQCQPNKHKIRDNKFGVTWCVKCGHLFTKPSNVELEDNDKILYICLK